MRGRAKVLGWVGVVVLATITLPISFGSNAARAAPVATPEMAHWLDDLEEIEIASLPAWKRGPHARNRRYVTLTIGGDLGFGGTGQPVVDGAGMRRGQRYKFHDLTRHLKPYLKSDLVFANLETVVTPSNGLTAYDKTFNFRMHPSGVAHLVEAGFNVLSTANNHAIDYGTAGMRHTLRELELLEPKGLLASHGIGATLNNILTPATFVSNHASFAFSAIGIGGVAPSNGAPGQLHYRSSRATDAIAALGRNKADYRMLSVHYGAELQVRPSQSDRKRLQSAIEESGVDLVIGHHAHTPAGIEMLGDSLVFYGLGNLLHLGMQTMDKFGSCRDFGAFARLHLVSDPDNGRLKVKAIEVYTLSHMNTGVRVRKGADGRQRIEALNYLGRELDDTQQRRSGVTFQPREDGSGLHCVPSAAKLDGPIGKLCANWQPPAEQSASIRRGLAHACRYRRKSAPIAKNAVPKLRGTMTASEQRQRRQRLVRQAFQSEN